MALTYSQLATQSKDAGFLARLQSALVQVIKQPNGPLLHEPPAPGSISFAAQQDRLARLVLADEVFWALQYSELVANQLIGKSTLLDPAVTTDADLFSATNAVFADKLPSL